LRESKGAVGLKKSVFVKLAAEMEAYRFKVEIDYKKKK